MSWSKIFVVAAVLALVSLLGPLAVVQGETDEADETVMTGSAVIRDSETHETGTSDQIQLTLANLAVLETDQAYEGWLISDDGADELSLGVIEVDADNNASHTFTHPDGNNLLATYSTLVVTVESVPDADPASSGVESYKDQIPSGGLLHIRHLIYSQAGNAAYDSGANEGLPKGILVGLLGQTDVAHTQAGLAVDATTLADIQSQACQVINVIEGSGGTNYDASCGDSGDGYGILSYAADREHAEFAVNSSALDVTMAEFQPQVNDSGANVANWAGQARDQALLARQTTNIILAKAFAKNLKTLTGRAHNGFDEDKDGTVEPILGEGGAHQAYTGAQTMATYDLEVAPAPAPTPTPTPVPAVVELPATGDTGLGMFALLALAAGVILLSGGGYVWVRARAWK